MTKHKTALRLFLEQSGTSQQAAADALGVSRSRICHLVSGQQSPSLALALRIEKWSESAVIVSDWPAPKRQALRAKKVKR